MPKGHFCTEICQETSEPGSYRDLACPETCEESSDLVGKSRIDSLNKYLILRSPSEIVVRGDLVYIEIAKVTGCSTYDLVLAIVLGGCLGLWGGCPTSGLGCLGLPAWCSEAATSGE